jgi:dihydrolipoamide dehydrogenase
MDAQLVVLGGGPGGYAAAFLAADLGMNVVLVDQEPRLGGVCLLRGCIPSKALLHVAKTMADARRLADWGVHYAEPAVDLAVMRARKEKVIATLSSGLKQVAAKRKVEVIRARAVLEDSHTLRLMPSPPAPLPRPTFGRCPERGATGDRPPADGRIRFEHCILATGSRPVALPGLVSSPRIMDSNAALELPDVPESLLVVGGGYIGLELGTVYAALGSRVSVVEMTDSLLPGVDRDLLKPLQKKLEKDFEAIYLQTKVAAVADKGAAVEVAFDGAEKKTRQFSRVLVSVGRRPNSEGLGLEKTHLEIDPRGFITVDPHRRTADPHILAIGDVAGPPMLAHKAAHEGKAAVEALAGQAAVFQPRAIPAVVFTDPEIAWAGLTEGEARQQGRPFEVVQFPWAASGRAQAVGRTEGLTKWLVEPASGRVLGCGIVGAGAGELVAEAVLAIEMGAAARDLVETIHPHPTLSETLGAAAEVFFGTATDLYKPRRALD